MAYPPPSGYGAPLAYNGTGPCGAPPTYSGTAPCGAPPAYSGTAPCGHSAAYSFQSSSPAAPQSCNPMQCAAPGYRETYMMPSSSGPQSQAVQPGSAAGVSQGQTSPSFGGSPCGMGYQAPQQENMASPPGGYQPAASWAAYGTPQAMDGHGTSPPPAPAHGYGSPPPAAPAYGYGNPALASPPGYNALPPPQQSYVPHHPGYPARPQPPNTAHPYPAPTPQGYMPGPPNNIAYPCPAPPPHGYPAPPQGFQGAPHGSPPAYGFAGYPPPAYGYPGFPPPAHGFHNPPPMGYPQPCGYGAPRDRMRSRSRDRDSKRIGAKKFLKPRAGKAKKASKPPKPKDEQPKAPAKKDSDGLTPHERSDQKEAEFKAKREGNPEATRESHPLELLRDRSPMPQAWIPVVEDAHCRSWMYMRNEAAITHADLGELKNKIEWRELHGAKGVTRKTMWFTKEGCTCPYTYGQERVQPETMPPWFSAMMRRWLHTVNLNDGGDNDSRLPDCCNLNLYDERSHAVAWHSDDEPLFMGKFKDTRIISVSLGGAMKFEVGYRAPRRGGILKPEKGSVKGVMLTHGSICTMEGLFQKHYLHQAKAGSHQPRVNATFRYIAEHDVDCPMRKRW